MALEAKGIWQYIKKIDPKILKSRYMSGFLKKKPKIAKF